MEPSLSGHHAGYLENAASAYLEAGYWVTATISHRDQLHPAIARLQAKYGDAFRIEFFDENLYERAFQSRLALVAREFAVRKLFHRAFRTVHGRNRVDFVFLPYLDYCLHALGLLGSPFGSVSWSGICMRPSFHYAQSGVFAPQPRLSGIKRFLFLRLLRNDSLASLLTIDELLYRHVRVHHKKKAYRLKYLPDPAELKGKHTRESARQMLRIPDDAIVILVYGSIDGRKGLEVLIEAVARAGDTLPKMHLLVVGRQSTSMQSLMSSQLVMSLVDEVRFHVIGEFVDDDIQQAVFVATDIVWLGYRNHYTMSGVLVLAGLARKPVLATSAGLIGWHTRTNNLGEVIDINDIGSVRAAIRKVWERGPRPLREGAQAFEKHTWENFKRQLVADTQP